MPSFYLYKGELKMEFEEVLLNRRSRRSYLNKEVEEEKIDKILNAGFHAPIASGKYHNLLIKVYKNESLKRLRNELTSLTNNDNTYNAPVVIFIYHKGENNDLANLDTGATIENMLLEATNIGLGSLFIYSFKRLCDNDPSFFKYKEVELESEKYLLRSIVSIGYIDNFEVRDIDHKMKVIKEY